LITATNKVNPSLRTLRRTKGSNKIEISGCASSPTEHQGTRALGHWGTGAQNYPAVVVLTSRTPIITLCLAMLLMLLLLTTPVQPIRKSLVGTADGTFSP
jgi:hypothetical protein